MQIPAWAIPIVLSAAGSLAGLTIYLARVIVGMAKRQLADTNAKIDRCAEKVEDTHEAVDGLDRRVFRLEVLLGGSGGEGNGPNGAYPRPPTQS